MTQANRPQLKLEGNTSENFKNFELRFNDYCIQADYRDLTKDPNTATEREAHYKKPILELAALRSALPDEALQVVRYTIEPQITADDKNKPWIWMTKLREHYTGSSDNSLMADKDKDKDKDKDLFIGPQIDFNSGKYNNHHRNPFKTGR